MILSIGAVFSERGIRFNISHKVDLYIRKKLICEIIKPFQIDKIEGARILSIDISTKKNAKY